MSNAASDASLRNQKIYRDTHALAVELIERKLLETAGVKVLAIKLTRQVRPGRAARLRRALSL